MKTNQLTEFRDEGQTNVVVDKPGSQMLLRADIAGIPKQIWIKVNTTRSKLSDKDKS